MDRTQFQHAHRVARTFHTFCTLALDAYNKTGDVDAVTHLGRWMRADFDPLKNAGVDMAAVYVDHCRGPSSGAFGPSVRALRQHPEELRRWLSHFRLRRIFRDAKRYPLPA